jgi:type VI secretion system protein ImpH
MGTALRQLSAGVADTLLAEPYRFEFFQAIRVLAAIQRKSANSRERNAPLDPIEAVRFRTAISLAFPASEIQQLVQRSAAGNAGEQEMLWEMVVSFMGMVGPSGVLPHHYTERLLERQIYFRDTAAHGFLDMFGHRMVSLFFHAWKKYRLPIEYELQPEALRRPKISAFFGLGLPREQDRFDRDDGRITVESAAYYGGLLAQHSRPSCNLVQLLQDHFGVPFQFEQFVGRWVELAPEQRTTLGHANSALDYSAVMGSRVWDRQTTAGLCIGPLSRSRFADFLPGRAAARELEKLVKFWSGTSLDYEVRLVLKKEEVAAARLGGREGSPPQLGWDSWMLSKEVSRDLHGAAYMIAA